MKTHCVNSNKILAEALKQRLQKRTKEYFFVARLSVIRRSPKKKETKSSK